MSDTIEVLDIINQPDGSAIMNMDVELEQTRDMVKTGLTYIVESMRTNDNMESIASNEFDSQTRTIEIPNDTFNALFHFGVIGAIRRGMADDSTKEDTEEDPEDDWGIAPEDRDYGVTLEEQLAWPDDTEEVSHEQNQEEDENRG